nr:Actin cytoskeleton-regulatory complex protein [Ipomoea batatas]
MSGFNSRVHFSVEKADTYKVAICTLLPIYIVPRSLSQLTQKTQQSSSIQIRIIARATADRLLRNKMAGAGNMMINGGNMTRSSRVEYERPIPMRGQVKVAAVRGLAHSLSSILSKGARSPRRRTGL